MLGALLRDIGQLGVADKILTKPDRLTDDECRTIQRHTPVGDELLRTSDALTAVASIVRAHHERLDAKGYPDQLGGEQISLEARSISVCEGPSLGNSVQLT